jgi:hypothetical protein
MGAPVREVSLRSSAARSRRSENSPAVLRRHLRSNVSRRLQSVCLSSIIIGPIAARDSAGSLSRFHFSEVAGAFDQIVRAVLHPCPPFSRLFTGAEKGMQIIHIESQSNYLTS